MSDYHVRFVVTILCICFFKIYLFKYFIYLCTRYKNTAYFVLF